jgi:H+/gluconate symporter-like permease
MRSENQIIRVNVSMVSLKWGDALSTLLPGALALFAVTGFFPPLDARIHNIEQVGTTLGIILLMGAALAGGILEAFTRVVWERYWLIPNCKPIDALKNLRADNLELYERGVQSSYKYVTFYANFAWAIGILILSRLHKGDSPCSALLWILVIIMLILLRGSHIQWTYFVNYLNKIFGERSDDAEKRSTSGDTSQIHKTVS